MSGRRLLRHLLPAALALLPLSLLAQNVSLDDTLRRWGYGREKTRSEGVSRWSLKGFTVEAEKDKRVVELGGVKIYLGRAALADNNSRLFINKSDLDKSILPILAPSRDKVPGLRTIVLDPGHGGDDPGNMNTKLGLNEKTMTLDVVRRMKSILETKGYRVLVTRTRDNFVELTNRSAFANRNRADLFVSIHFNGAKTAAAEGLETYCLTPAGQYSTNDAGNKANDTSEETGNRNDRWNVLLAYYVQKTLVDKLDSEDRGVRRARFKVLCDLNCPGVLVECGYLNNPGEAAKIASPVYREKIAQGVSDAVSLYGARLGRLSGKPAAQ